MATALRCAVAGTDTGVGKTHVMQMLVHGLRQLGRRVWLHKPVACGGWDGRSAEDGRALADLAGDGQEASTVCPRQWPAAAAPHLAAAEAGDAVDMATLIATARPLLDGAHDLLLEGAGGIASPLSADRADLCAMLRALDLPAVVVARPHLGTLNHSALSIDYLRRHADEPLGLIVNEHEVIAEDLATRTVVAELEALCDLPVLARLSHDTRGDGAQAVALAEAVLARHHERSASR